VNFQPELAQAVMAGRKTVTRRLVSDNPRSPWYRGACALKVGRDYAVCPGRGKHAIGRVRIVAVEMQTLATLVNGGGDEEARREGFANLSAFWDAWTAINGAPDMRSLVWRVEFEVVA
jgi:hypothetical protein